MTALPERPAYTELPTLGDTGERCSWDYFGREDEFGCLNFITPDVVAAAAREVSTGQVVNLNLPLGEPQPQFWATREAPQHRTLKRGRNVRDDYIDRLYTQGSTQWDGFRHIRYREFGYYGGRNDEDLDLRGELGIASWAERGVIGRGVLLDVHASVEPAPDERFPIGPEVVEATLRAQETAVREGDILLIRTGWVDWYRGLPVKVRGELATRLNADRKSAALPGLDPGVEMAAWLWDHGIAAVAFDNPTAEALPFVPSEGWAHHRLLALLGLPLGELWSLKSLATACASNSRWTFMLTTAPMYIPGGVATPANAYAVL